MGQGKPAPQMFPCVPEGVPQGGLRQGSMENFSGKSCAGVSPGSWHAVHPTGITKLPGIAQEGLDDRICSRMIDLHCFLPLRPAMSWH